MLSATLLTAIGRASVTAKVTARVRVTVGVRLGFAYEEAAVGQSDPPSVLALHHLRPQ